MCIGQKFSKVRVARQKRLPTCCSSVRIWSPASLPSHRTRQRARRFRSSTTTAARADSRVSRWVARRRAWVGARRSSSRRGGPRSKRARGARAEEKTATPIETTQVLGAAALLRRLCERDAAGRVAVAEARAGARREPPFFRETHNSRAAWSGRGRSDSPIRTLGRRPGARGGASSRRHGPGAPRQLSVGRAARCEATRVVRRSDGFGDARPRAPAVGGFGSEKKGTWARRPRAAPRGTRCPARRPARRGTCGRATTARCRRRRARARATSRPVSSTARWGSSTS